MTVPRTSTVHHKNELGTELREKLEQNRTYYVRTDGSDSNDGLTDSAGGAFLTTAGALSNIKSSVDAAGYTITIQIKDGTFVENTVTCPSIVGCDNVIIQGNSGTPANVVLDGGFLIQQDNTSYSIKDMKLIKSSGTATIGIKSVNGTFYIYNLEFSTGFTFHMQSLGGGIVLSSSYKITGGAVRHYAVQNNGIIQYGATITITLTGTPAFSQWFASAITGGIISLWNTAVTFSGSATGTRYLAQTNAVIDTQGGGATFLPGSVAGTTDGFGVYG